MKLNEGKFHLLISGHKQELSWPNIRRSGICESEKQKPFGIVIDRNLRFDGYILSQCKKAVRKLNVLVRIWKCMIIERKRMLMKTFINISLVIVLLDGYVLIKVVIIVIIV